MKQMTSHFSGTYSIEWHKWIILGWSSGSLATSQAFLLIYTARRSFTYALAPLQFLPTSITGKLAGESNGREQIIQGMGK